MADFDLSKLPPLLPADVARTNVTYNRDGSIGGGLPTEALVDWETATSAFNQSQLVALNTKITTISNEYDGLSGSVTEISKVVKNDDGSYTAGKLTQVALQSSSSAGKIVDISAVIRNPDGTFTADRLTGVSTQVGTNTADITALTTSYNGIAVNYSLTGTIDGASGSLIFSGVKKNDGSGATFGLALTLNNFSITDPAYNGGAPGNVLSYSTALGAFNFGVPILFNYQSITERSLIPYQHKFFSSDYTVGSGTQNTGFYSPPDCELTLMQDFEGLAEFLFTGRVQPVAVSGQSSVTFYLAFFIDGTEYYRVYEITNQVSNQTIDVNKSYKIPVGPGNHTYALKVLYQGGGNGVGAIAKIISASRFTVNFFRR